jgi:hypothetical protein
VKQIRKRLTYANVMSSIAVFLVLGGATAIAAGLAKNSVGSKQLKKGAVTTAKIKKNAVTTAKIKNKAVTGAKINLGSLGTVPSATHATTADTAKSAETAKSADNANTVAGNTIRKIFYDTNATTAKTELLSLGGLILTASCESGEPELIATTSVGNSGIHSVTVNNSDETFYDEDDEFNPGEPFDVFEGETDSAQTTFTYGSPTGSTVIGSIGIEEGDFNNNDCALFGSVTIG